MELVDEINGVECEISSRWLCEHGEGVDPKGFLVQASEKGLYHWICENCYRAGIYYCQRITLDGLLIKY